MELRAFSFNAVSKLLDSIDGNRLEYAKSQSWALDFVANVLNPVISTKVSVAGGIKLKNADDEGLYDLENSIKLHKLLSKLTPVQARDPRLWTYLCHVDCWDYMRSRWSEVSKSDNYIKEHYFVPGQASRALSRNGIARLWWYGYLSYDPSRTNPYELTAVLLDKQDITNTVLERSLGRNKEVRLAFLDYLLERNDVFLKPGNKSRFAVRALAKSLNLQGGDCLLDSLSRKEIRKIFEREFPRIKSEFS